MMIQLEAECALNAESDQMQFVASGREYVSVRQITRCFGTTRFVPERA
jgi:hypothetical protein